MAAAFVSDQVRSAKMVVPMPPSVETQPRIALDVRPQMAVQTHGDQEYVVVDLARQPKRAVEFVIKTSHGPARDPASYQLSPLQAARYLQDDPMYNMRAPIIFDAFTAIKGMQTGDAAGDRLALTTRIFTWARSRIGGGNDGRWLSADEVLLARAGSCTEFGFVVAALMRSFGIPTRAVAGTNHRWVQAHVPGRGWLDFESPSDGKPLDGHPFVFHTQSQSCPLIYDGWDYRPMIQVDGSWKPTGWQSVRGSFSATQSVSPCP
jgi:hypothetical protein